MLRKIITIDQEKCNGCGLCAQACHEQAIGMVDGKAALLRLLNKYPLKSPDKVAILSKDSMARFYTFGLADSLKYWITHDIPYSSDQLYEAYSYIIRNSILDLIEFPGSRI